MPTIVHELTTPAPLEAVWWALHAVDQLHTRPVVGFVVDTVMAEPDVRMVTFATAARFASA